MRLLIIGGTRFLGRHLAAQALEAGHQVTLLHRGLSGPALFPEAEHRIGDRNGDLASLLGPGHSSQWDAVIDTSAYVPRHVRTLATALAGRVGQYQFVSSISAYAGEHSADDPPVDESASLAELADPASEELTGATYGGLKALCERAASEAFGARGTPVLISRPGLIVGPFDPSERFTWWANRIARGGLTLAPGDPTLPVQVIDGRDAAQWMLKQAEAHATGTFNLVGPSTPLTMGDFLVLARETLGSDSRFEWVDEAFLLANNVAPWVEIPLWLPRAQAGLSRVDFTRAVASGLALRPLEQTVADTAAWAASRPANAPPVPGAMARPTVGISPAREAELLHAWASRTAAP
jgi:2'-hydroxyisoflavone reductase